MTNHVFYLPGIDKLTGLSQEDWQFLTEQAEENGIAPATLASQIIASELAMWREQIRYANMMEEEQVLRETKLEKLVEEAMC
jgi:hypothetical protein